MNSNYDDDDEYMSKANLRELLRLFALDAMISRPADLREYMIEWANKRIVEATNDTNSTHS